MQDTVLQNKTIWAFYNAGTLHRADKRVLINETADSRRNHDHPDWDPEWVKSNFFSLLRCSSPACQEYVHIVGTTDVQPSYDEEYGHCMEEFLYPLFISTCYCLVLSIFFSLFFSGQFKAESGHTVWNHEDKTACVVTPQPWLWSIGYWEKCKYIFLLIMYNT